MKLLKGAHREAVGAFVNLVRCLFRREHGGAVGLGCAGVADCGGLFRNANMAGFERGRIVNPETLNRLHDLRCMSQDLRRKVEADRVWHVACQLAAVESELTDAIAHVNALLAIESPAVSTLPTNKSRS